MTYAVEKAGTVEEAGWRAARADGTQRLRWAFSAAAAALVWAMLLASPDILLQDPDIWWHVKVGLDILSSGALPIADTYSHTFAGQPWIAKEWLGQVLLALAHRAGGWSGTALLTASSVASAAFLLAWHLSAVLKPLAAVGLTLLAAFLVSPIFDARPVALTLPLAVAWTAHLFAAAREGRAPPFWLLAVMCLWANLHAGFTLGFAIAFFAGLALLERTRFADPLLVGRWVGFGLLCLLAGLLHPYGVQALSATFTLASDAEAVPLIGEWRPFDASAHRPQEAVLLLGLVGLLVSGFRVGWAKALFLAFALHLYLSHVRFIYLPALLVPLAFAPELAAQYPRLSARAWAQARRDGLERLLTERFQPAALGLAGLAAAAAALFMASAAPTPKTATAATGAIAFAKAHGLSGNVLNSYGLGGTLIFHDVKTFIDGRTDQLFLGGFMRRDDAMGTSAGKPILVEALDRHAIDWALLVKNDPRIPFFDELPGWRRLHADEDTVIFARDGRRGAAPLHP